MDSLYEPHLESRYAVLSEKLKNYQPLFNEKLLRTAYQFMIEAHATQKRKSGEPYAIHPLEVAINVSDMSLDLDSIIAALLHDTIEDTGYEHDDIAERFGEQVAHLVEGVTKLTRVPYISKEDHQMENLRKMFLAMSRDIRVILIKIADRLHNMRTIEFHVESKRREKSLETMEIYAPLAHRLGMQRIKWELEDLSLKNLDPIGFAEITKELEIKERDRTNFLDQVRATISQRLKEVNIKADIKGRVKHIYSIYRKMYNMHKALFEIYDLYAVRVIVDDLNDCYNVLGFVHDLYKPIPGRFKDYISTPKPNMYQSLHTTVIGREGVPFEVQIRTRDMHHTAEYGIAAHWKYKQGVAGVDLDDKLEWVRRLLESQQDTDAEDFLRSIKVDMFADEVFVFTPQGDVINLPAGANPIDFAYAIHSAVGNRMVGVKVNGRIVSIDYNLQNGDIVEIITTGSRGPSRDWLKMVKTAEAKNKIKQWFKKERREENIIEGKADFEREVKRAGLTLSAILVDEVLIPTLKKMSFTDIEDMYAAIGFGGITINRVLNRFRDELIRINRMQSDKNALEKLISNIKKPKKTNSGVIVDGQDNCLVKFSRCCAPVPGDDIIGFTTRGYGVSVHRTDCQNVLQNKGNAEEKERWVKVRWAKDVSANSFQAGLQVYAHDQNGLLLEVMTVLKNEGIKTLSISGKTVDLNFALINLMVEVKNKAQLESVQNRIRKATGVIEVHRKDVD